jgi:type II secretory pathway component PulF
MNENNLNQEHEKKTKQREKIIKLLIYLMTLLVITFVIIGALTKLNLI